MGRGYGGKGSHCPMLLSEIVASPCVLHYSLHIYLYSSLAVLIVLYNFWSINIIGYIDTRSHIIRLKYIFIVDVPRNGVAHVSLQDEIS